MIYVFITSLIFCVHGYAQSDYFAKNPQGWHWNNLIDKRMQKRIMKSKNMSAAKDSDDSPISQMKAIHKALEIAKDRAVLNPTVSNIHEYLVIQNMITEQSTQFAQNWQRTILLYPEFDYNLKHPVESSENQAFQSQVHDLKVRAVNQLSKNDGLFYFYRGNNTLDQVMAKTVTQFANWYHFSLIGISVDNKILPNIKNNKINQGQAQLLGIKALPALVLINPKTGSHSILSYGYASNDELLTSCFNLSTNFRRLR